MSWYCMLCGDELPSPAGTDEGTGYYTTQIHVDRDGHVFESRTIWEPCSGVPAVMRRVGWRWRRNLLYQASKGDRVVYPKW